MPQLQTNMECLDLEMCHLVQYQPSSYPGADDGVLDITYVPRDRGWWKIYGAVLRESYARFRVEWEKRTPEQLEMAWKAQLRPAPALRLRPRAGPHRPRVRLDGLPGWNGGTTDAALAVEEFAPEGGETGTGTGTETETRLR